MKTALSNKDKRHLKSEFEPLQTSETLSRIFHLVQFVKCWQFFLELKRLPSKLRNRKSSSCVHVLHETWNKAFSRHTRAVTAKKCSKKREARAELFCQSKPTVFLFAVLVDVAVAQLSNEVLWPKQQLCTCITFFSTFLWRPLHYCDVKPPNATLYGGRGHTTTNFPLSISTWIKPLRIQLQEKLGFQIDAIKFERTQIHSFGDVFTAAAVVVVA